MAAAFEECLDVHRVSEMLSFREFGFIKELPQWKKGGERG